MKMATASLNRLDQNELDLIFEKDKQQFRKQ